MARLDIDTIRQTMEDKLHIEELRAKVLEAGVKVMSHPAVQQALGHPIVSKGVEKLLATRDKLVKTYELWKEW